MANETKDGSSYWAGVSDAQLLKEELTTNDPESAEDLVKELPADWRNAHIAMTYDLRGTGCPKFLCVHGNHQHRCGCVMKAGETSYLVGWRCARIQYGEDILARKADHHAARVRQKLLIRRSELVDILRPFTAWLETLVNSNIFEKFDRICDELFDKAQWIYENGANRIYYPSLQSSITLPQNMFIRNIDPNKDLKKTAVELCSLEHHLMKRDKIDDDVIRRFKKTGRSIIDRVIAAIDALKEPVDFFQPAILMEICESACRYNPSSKRFYVARLNSIVCKRKGKSDSIIALPESYIVPDQRVLEVLKEQLQRL